MPEGLQGNFPQAAQDGVSLLSWVGAHTPPVPHECPTSNASSKTQCQHDCIGRKSVVLLSTHLTLAEGQASSENDPIEMCPIHLAFLLSCLVLGCVVPPFAQPYNCSRKSAARGNPWLSLGQCPTCVVALWFFSSHRMEALKGVHAAFLISKF